MGRAFVKKIKAILAEGKNGDNALEILNVAAYFASTDIRIGMFSSIISDRSELKAAILSLEKHSLVKCYKANKFFIPDSIAVNLRNHLGRTGVKESILKKAILVLSKARRNIDYPHFVSFHKYAKESPKVLEELDDLPGQTIMGLLKGGKLREAVEFGTECDMYLTKILGEHHITVLDLECNLGVAFTLAKREDAVKFLTSVYKKSCKFGRDIDVKKTMFALLQTIFSNTSPFPFWQSFSEMTVRSIIFPGQSISDCNNDSELKKWLDYAKMLNDVNMFPQALAIIQDVIKRRSILFGQEDRDILAAMELKAIVLANHNRPNKLLIKEALKLLEYVYEKKNKIFGPLNKMTIGTMGNIGQILFSLGSLREAMSLFENVIIHIKEIDDESVVIYEKAMTDMIKICMIQEDFVKALQLSLDLLAKYESIYDDVNLKCLDCRKTQSDIYLLLKKPQKSLEVLKKIVEDFRYELEEDELEFFYTKIIMIERIPAFDDLRSFDAPAGTLHSIAKDGNLELLLSLIQSGEDIESRDSTGMTPLHYASAFGQVEVARALLEKGAKNPSKALPGPTPLEVAEGSQVKTLLKTVHSFYEAVKEDRLDDVIDMALEEPCVLGAKDEQGCTPLHWAALRGHRAVSSLLLEFGSRPDAVSDKGNSPLHIAASKGHAEIAEAILIRAAATVSLQLLLDGRTGSGGNTPLHAAAQKGHAATARVLLAHGAAWSARNAAGKTPFEAGEDWDCRNLLGLVEGLFRDAREGEVGAACAKLRGLEGGEVVAVAKARDGDRGNLLQVAVKMKHSALVKKLVKMLKYVPSDG